MRALLIIDMQNDFLVTGTVPVAMTDTIIPNIISLIPKFDFVIATQDWHPIDHVSFAINHGKRPGEIIETANTTQLLWPSHCIRDSLGAEIVAPIQRENLQKIFKKAASTDVDSSSIFFDATGKPSTSIDTYLKKHNIQELYFTGVISEFAIVDSINDANKLGYSTYFVEDGCGGLHQESNQHERFLRELKKEGTKVVFSQFC